MTDQVLFNQLSRDEGLRLAAYPDPLSGGDPWTIGYGHTGKDVAKGMVWTEDEAIVTLEQDILSADNLLDVKLPWWISLIAPRRRVLENMCFNLGIGGLLGFPHMLAACQSGDYEEASAQMLSSVWATQVGQRATRLAKQMSTGLDQ